MDFSRIEPPPDYSQRNEPQKYPPGQAHYYCQAQAPYGQPTESYPAGLAGAYGQPIQSGYSHHVVVTQPMATVRPIGTPSPPDYMIPSILVCLFCFCPTGIVAIYYANRRTNMLAAGDMVEAQRSANIARNLMITSIVLGICWIIIVIVIRVAVWSSLYGGTYY